MASGPTSSSRLNTPNYRQGRRRLYNELLYTEWKTLEDFYMGTMIVTVGSVLNDNKRIWMGGVCWESIIGWVGDVYTRWVKVNFRDVYRGRLWERKWNTFLGAGNVGNFCKGKIIGTLLRGYRGSVIDRVGGVSTCSIIEWEGSLQACYRQRGRLLCSHP
jgi:hypothetical protein